MPRLTRPEGHPAPSMTEKGAARTVASNPDIANFAQAANQAANQAAAPAAASATGPERTGEPGSSGGAGEAQSLMGATGMSRRVQEVSEEECEEAFKRDCAESEDAPLSYETCRYLWMAQNGYTVKGRVWVLKMLTDDKGGMNRRCSAISRQMVTFSKWDQQPEREVVPWVMACESVLTTAFSMGEEDLRPGLERILEEQESAIAGFQEYKLNESREDDDEGCEDDDEGGCEDDDEGCEDDDEGGCEDDDEGCEYGCAGCCDLPIERSEDEKAVRKRIAWGLPTREFLEKVGGFIGAEDFLLGLGSGHGYLEFCIGMWTGARVRCTDPRRPSLDTHLPWIELGPVEPLDGDAAVEKYGKRATVLILAFPPGGLWEHGEREERRVWREHGAVGEEYWTSRAVRTWREGGGQKLLLVDSVIGHGLLGGERLTAEMFNWERVESEEIRSEGRGVTTWADFYRAR